MFTFFHSKHLSILFSAITNGVFLIRSNSSDSRVCFSRPCMRSMTRMAKSQRDEPLDLRLEKDSWPGVSMIKSPGMLVWTGKNFSHFLVSSLSLLPGKKVAPICWVMPPASPSWTLVFLILSSSVVLPVSTWPRMQQIGDLRLPCEVNWLKSSLRSF